jgi:hypothetical protein
MLMIPHCVDSQLTDGGEVVNLTLRPRSTPHKHFFGCILLNSYNSNCIFLRYLNVKEASYSASCHCNCTTNKWTSPNLALGAALAKLVSMIPLSEKDRYYTAIPRSPIEFVTVRFHVICGGLFRKPSLFVR